MSTPVVLLTQGYSYTQTTDSTTGTKVFVDEAAYTSPPTTVELPELGDSWDVTFLGLRVYEIVTELIDPGCSSVQKYTVSYSTANMSLEDEDDTFPVTVEQSADYLTYNDTRSDYGDAGHWLWPEGGAPEERRAIDLKVRKREITTTITIHRKLIEVSDFEGFLQASSSCAGKVNNDTDFALARTGITFPKESVLYTGCSSTEGSTISGRKIWQVQMRFVLKDPEGDWSDDGWQKAYNPNTNSYQIPTHSADGSKLYQSTAFSALFLNSSAYDT